MKVVSVGGYWLATGTGPLRAIAVEGGTMKAACLNYMEVVIEQLEAKRG